MSQRPRAHQIEDISARRFAEALPQSWVSRQISPDYGVDCEVEIFTANDNSTGIKFAVQLKATDDRGRGDRVSLKVTQLDYLLDYDLPGIVVRYDANADVMRWQWASVISARTLLKVGQKSFTYHFDPTDIWNEQTSAKIERILRARRALATFPASASMPVRMEIAPCASRARYEVERTVRAIITEGGGTLVAANADPAEVELYIRVRHNFLSVDFEMLGSVTFDLDASDVSQLKSAILYAMCFLFARQRLVRHGHAAGRAILDGRHIAGNADLVARASYAFADNAMAQAELAILNDLHVAESVHYPIIVGKLMEASGRDGGPDAVACFLGAALETADGDPIRAATIHYSTANALRRTEPARALFHYNRARHLRPSYFDADYFLSEIAGTLFTSKRYSCAIEGYSRAIAIAPTHRLRLCLGDALLYSGAAQAAALQFDLASQSDVAQLVEEAIVKLNLSHMLVASYGPHVTADWSKPMGDVPRGEDERAAWLEHLMTVNALDPLAHFNLGVSDAALGNDVSALGHFVACAIIQSSDVEAWSNAIICAFRAGEAELVVTLLHLSISLAGLEAYDRLRANLLAQGGEPTLLAELDTLAFAADARPDPTISQSVTLRILDGDHAVVIDGRI